jgi:hypothetical protein
MTTEHSMEDIARMSATGEAFIITTHTRRDASKRLRRELNEKRARKLFTQWGQAIADSGAKPNDTDCMWAMAQMMANILMRQSDAQQKTEQMRSFMAMVTLASSNLPAHLPADVSELGARH